jgi:viroplasmin and RNaseH domain-containing protein
MTIPNNKRLHTTNPFLKSSSDVENLLEMTISDKKRHDYCVLKLDPLGSNSFDAAYDAYKLFGLPEAPAIYMVKGKEIASSSYFPEEYENQSVSLGFYAGVSGEQEISFDNIESFNENVLIYLLDKKDESYTLLNENSNYSFTAEKGRNDKRFEIHFTTSPLDVEENIEENSKIKIYTYEDKLYLRNNSNEKVFFTVVSLLGQQLTQLELEANSSIVKPLNIKAQTLIIQAKSTNFSKTEKVSLH